MHFGRDKVWSLYVLREEWRNFFVSKGHEWIEPIPLIPPEEDKSILFTNSGLCAVKSKFIEGRDRKNNLFSNSQKVIRTSDINNMERNTWHSTYFEMLGCFSVGGYFKREAILYSFEFLTQVLKFNPGNLVITVHENDLESEQIWREILGDKAQIVRLGELNFWEIGEGPCGPCTEIYYDRGIRFDAENEGLHLIKFEKSNERYIEILNIVFSQFWKSKGQYRELHSKNIDIGGGLERILAILENADNIYLSSGFFPIIQKLKRFSRREYVKECFPKNKADSAEQNNFNSQYNVISDHIRALIMILSEDILPSNKGRGYIARKLIRRIIVGFEILEVTQIAEAISSILDVGVEILSEIHPHLEYKKGTILEKIIAEIRIFQKIMLEYRDIVEREISEIKKTEIKIEMVVFTLFERYGVPLPLIKKVLGERGIKFSEIEFSKLYEAHRSSSKNKKFSSPFQL